jgi:uncharacterized protein YutE (UPF0331/DUF86 family)
MTYLVERLAELSRHLSHLRELSPRVEGRETLTRDMSLRNDVLFSLLMVAQLVIDIAGELAARRGDRFEDYAGAIRALSGDERFPPDLVGALEPLPGFRNIVVHEYVALDLNRVVDALNQLGPVDRFCQIVAQIESVS